MTDIVQILREMQQEEDCPMLVHIAFSEAIREITRLRAELSAAKLYQPCKKYSEPHIPVKPIGPCNFSFYGIEETDLEFAERAGTQIQEVADEQDAKNEAAENATR